jgi:hypothetical protein
MLFNVTPKTSIDETKVLLRCTCGHEYSPLRNRPCPACHVKDPAAIAPDGVTWQTMSQFKLANLRELLQPGALDEVPEEHRERLRQSIESQVATLESGGG